MLAHRIAEKRQARAAVVAQIRAISDRTKAAGSTSSEDRTLWDKGEADIAKLDEEIRTLEGDLARERRLAALSAEAPRQQSGAPARDPNKATRKAFRSWIRRGAGSLTEEQRGLLEGVRAWTIDEEREEAERDGEYRDLQQDIPSAGGYLVPEQQLLSMLIKSIDDETFIRRLATVQPVVGAQSLGVPTLTADPADADWTGELGPVSADSSMAFGKREMVPRMLSKLMKVSMKLLSGASNPEALVMQRLGYKFAITQEKAFLTGSGSGQPLGIFTPSADGIPTSRDVSTDNTTTTIEADNLINVKYSVKGGYQTRGSWLFHRDALMRIRKLKDGDGQYIWQAGISADAMDTILGRPVYQSEYVPNTFTTGLYVGIFGDFSHYMIADTGTFSVTRLQELYQVTNQIGFIGRMMLDGAPTLGEAFARVKMA